MLVVSALFALVAYRLARINRLEERDGHRTRYDAVIVGGGHNGLVAGFYLATAGLRHGLILERRDIVGGCCVTEEFAPGYRASTGAYVLSMLREPVWRDMRLIERGDHGRPAGPGLNRLRRRLARFFSTRTSAPPRRS